MAAFLPGLRTGLHVCMVFGDIFFHVNVSIVCLKIFIGFFITNSMFFWLGPRWQYYPFFKGVVPPPISRAEGKDLHPLAYCIPKTRIFVDLSNLNLRIFNNKILGSMTYVYLKHFSLIFRGQ